MSLIQEALHRKASEDGPPPPPAPPPRPGRGHPALWVVLLILLFAASGVALWYLNPSFFIRSKPESGPKPAPLAPAVPRQDEAAPAPSAPKTPAEAAAPPALEPPPPPIETVAPAPVEKEPAMEAPPPVVAEKAPAAAPAAPPSELKPAEKPKDKEEAKAKRWPTLKLTGVMVGHGEKSKGSAFLNGSFVEVGDRIDEVRLVEVDAKGVRLEFQGEKKYLRLGQSLP
ncbi:MAG TPA: hypothetical protein P5567_01910 [Kiritimatiellia bacterium]|nr:hypothetical protein [Kiritimatiellia bacterium]HRZ11190.1 hypothetical protein [Kiritimatiellia bacterium]HSA19041.1 hypothetical protein [Kiritimatiellia bacterium]